MEHISIAADLARIPYLLDMEWNSGDFLKRSDIFIEITSPII